MVAGLIPPDVVKIVLFAAFGFYIFSGLFMFVLGIVYMTDVGAIGTGGVYMIVFGLIMWVIAGIGIWATKTDNWKTLFAVELVNIALFLALYHIIVIGLMMATGVTDPVRKTTDENWNQILPTLTLMGSNPDGVGTYCQYQTGDHTSACGNYYGRSVPFDSCVMSDFLVMTGLNNCSKFLAGPDSIDDGDCSAAYGDCLACQDLCKETQIQEVKSNLQPATSFAIFFTIYLVVTIVWNGVMTAEDSIEGTARITGIVLNGLLSVVSFVIIIMAAVASAGASKSCPADTDCVPPALYYMMLIAVAVMGLGAVSTLGCWYDREIFVIIATVVMVFFATFLVLFAMLLSISAGVFMEDMGYYYDTQYPKLRSAYERADNSYCQMNLEQCTDMARNGAGADGIIGTADDKSAPVMTDDYSSDVTDNDDNKIEMPFEELWPNMYAEAAREAAMDELDVGGLAPEWLSACATSPICVWCQDLYERVENHTLGVYGPNAPAQNVGKPCTPATDGANCYHGAPNFKWSHGITGTDYMEYAVLETTTTDSITNVQTRKYIQQPLSKCVSNLPTDLGNNDKCVHVTSLSPGDQGAVYPGSTDTIPCRDAAAPCIRPLDSNGQAANGSADPTADGYRTATCNCNSPGVCIEYMARCPVSRLIEPDCPYATPNCGATRFKLDAAQSQTFTGGFGDPSEERPLGYALPSLSFTCESPSWPNAYGDQNLAGCKKIARVVPYESVGNIRGWNDIINNYTRFDLKSRRSMPYCEEAITDYIRNPKYCNDNSDTVAAGEVADIGGLMRMDTYLGNCGDCDDAWTPFSFTLGSDEETQRKCLNFFVGHMDAMCTAEGAATCLQEFQGRTTAPVISGQAATAHVKFMTDKAFDGSSSSQFCGYSDDGCKAKIKYDIESSMTTISVLGVIFLLLYLFVILCTMEAIKEMGDFNIPDMSNPFKKEEDSAEEDEDTSSSDED